MDAGLLQSKLEGVAPIESIIIGVESDKSTWMIVFNKTTTEEQRLAAQAIIDSIDPNAPDISEVKDEAARRILARYPDWKQRNMTARGVELTFKVAGGLALSLDELAEADALRQVWSWIKLVRVASDKLEALPSGIPIDFKNDFYWPA